MAVISCAVSWYFRFQLSLRDIEELLFERGVTVSYETVQRWCHNFGACFAHRAKAARRKPGTMWHLDEVFVTLCGEPYLFVSNVSLSSSMSVTRRFCCCPASRHRKLRLECGAMTVHKTHFKDP